MKVPIAAVNINMGQLLVNMTDKSLVQGREMPWYFQTNFKEQVINWMSTLPDRQVCMWCKPR